MSEIQHKQLPQMIDDKRREPLPGSFLIHGQEMLVEQSLQQLMAELLQGGSADLCCEKVEGMLENVSDVLERLNTFALLAGPKIVVFTEARLFEGRGNHQQMAERIIEAWEGDDVHRAAKLFLGLCGRFDIDLDGAFHGAQDIDALKILRGRTGTETVKKIIQYCHSQGWVPSAADNQVLAMQKAIEKGFPQNHYLIVTVHTRVPKNLKLYKTFREHGVVIDCNIPKGERRADKAAQEAVLRQSLEDLLNKAKKRFEPGAFQLLCKLTGFDPRAFVQNVEKLIDYAGRRDEITREDIDAVVKRTKVDPVFDLTNAVADRNLVLSLSYTQTLLDAKWHPLQILSALANQIRKLLVAKSFAQSRHGKCWARGMAYPQFQNAVMPAIEAYDQQSRERSASWLHTLAEAGKKKGSSSSKKVQDVILAANPKSPYPVYQTLLKSDNFTLQELTGAMLTLNQTDIRLKSSGQDHGLALKKAIMEICGT